MGRKDVGAGKYILLCAACIALALVTGCTTLSDLQSRYNAGQALSEGQVQLAQQEFDRAAEENRRALRIYAKGPPADQALFNLGVIYAREDNRERDYDRAVHYFQELVMDFPGSQLRDEAVVWTGVLQDLQHTEAERRSGEATINIMNDKIEALEHLLTGQKMLADNNFSGALQENVNALEAKFDSPVADEALYHLGLIYAHQDNPEKDFLRASQYFSRLVQEYPESPLSPHAKIWVGVLNVIEKSKQVDIEIEKRKKELER